MHPRFERKFFEENFRRGAGVVTEQIANLSTRKCRQGSSPCLSAIALHSRSDGGHYKLKLGALPKVALKSTKYLWIRFWNLVLAPDSYREQFDTFGV